MGYGAKRDEKVQLILIHPTDPYGTSIDIFLSISLSNSYLTQCLVSHTRMILFQDGDSVKEADLGCWMPGGGWVIRRLLVRG